MTNLKNLNDSDNAELINEISLGAKVATKYGIGTVVAKMMLNFDKKITYVVDLSWTDACFEKKDLKEIYQTKVILFETTYIQIPKISELSKSFLKHFLPRICCMDHTPMCGCGSAAICGSCQARKPQIYFSQNLF